MKKKKEPKKSKFWKCPDCKRETMLLICPCKKDKPKDLDLQIEEPTSTEEMTTEQKARLKRKLRRQLRRERQKENSTEVSS